MIKKILHIPNYYPPHIGGIEDVCHSIVSAMGSSEFEHKVFCFNDNRKTVREIHKGVEVIRIGSVFKLHSQSLAPSYLPELKKVIRHFEPDVVHFHTPNPFASTALLVALPAHTRLIVHWHSDIIEQKKLYAFYRHLEERLLRRADVILSTSPLYSVSSQALKPWLKKIVVLPNVIETSRFNLNDNDREEIATIRHHYGDQKIIFFLGRHVPYKGLEYLLEAEKLIDPGAVLIIAGHGPLTKKLKVSYHSPRIKFIGKVSESHLRHYLYASDVFAFPSITKNEAFGIALAEAMYCGLPAVTFTIPGSGVNWVNIDTETGLEVANKNVPAFAGAINRLLEDESLKKQLGANARKRVEELFTTDAIKNDLISLYGQQN